MMKLTRIEPLKEVYSRLRKLVIKTRITVEEKEEQEIRSSSKIDIEAQVIQRLQYVIFN